MATRSMAVSTSEVAKTIAAVCDTETIARLLDCLVAIESENVTDRQAYIGSILFDDLARLVPDALPT